LNIPKLFSQAAKCKLLEIKWWNWEVEMIKARLDDLYGEPAAFVKKYLKGTRQIQAPFST